MDFLIAVRPVLYRCPRTAKLVQHLIADEPKSEEQNRYDEVSCLACSFPHLINRVTGKLLGEKD
jgi:hypothetical protein